VNSDIRLLYSGKYAIFESVKGKNKMATSRQDITCIEILLKYIIEKVVKSHQD